ncbi:hypothetical protein PV328_000780 [Microctonus aethiopoides]|uniref:DRBM domain-containing protein n=1 Tax=Microctonus aethiopoides TaxID=144406 RepID=A0AA39KWT5_9HYME|nr:hypothetical protein PV328_000780 [Microctonus aethiopoides]
MAEIKLHPICVLLDYCQKKKFRLPTYTFVGRTGPGHDTIFTIRVSWNSIHVDGEGKNKKSAKYDATEKMICLMKGINHQINYNDSAVHFPTTSIHKPEEILIHEDMPESQSEANSSVNSSVNSVRKLKKLCNKYKMISPVYEESNADSNNNFTVRCIVNNIIEEATASSKNKAKKICAKQMIHHLNDLKLIHDYRLSATNIIPKVFNSPKDFHISSKPILQTTMSSSSQLSMENTLKSFIEQQLQFNNHLLDLMTKQNEKLNDIKSIVKSLSEHQVRIQKLEQHNALNSKRMADLTEQYKIMSNELQALKQSLVSTSSVS